VNLLLWIVLCAAAAVLIYSLLVYAATRGILRSYRRTPARVQSEMGFAEPEDLGLKGEALQVEVEPGIELRGFIFRTDAPRRGLLIYHHGIWDALRPRLKLAVHMLPLGFDVLMYDSRGHGQSGGRYCTYGTYESIDLIRMIDEVKSMGVDTSHVAIVGHSMGGATAVYTALKDARIKALVLEACYRDLHTAIRDYARYWVPFIPEFIVRAAERRAQRKAGFKLEDLSPLRLMPKLTIPVMIVQGTADEQIKPEYAQEHFDALPEPRTLHWIEGARHGRVWHEGGDAYMGVLADWLQDKMPELQPQD
jgi:alpha-beta hydrolase superfamily lysophospholipase